MHRIYRLNIQKPVLRFCSTLQKKKKKRFTAKKQSLLWHFHSDFFPVGKMNDNIKHTQKKSHAMKIYPQIFKLLTNKTISVTCIVLKSIDDRDFIFRLRVKQ